MINSMTGYGFGTYTENGMVATAEIRSVNNRYNEINIKIPKILANRENEIKDIIREKISRGKINLSISFNKELENNIPIKINTSAVKSYVKLLNEIRKAAKIKEQIKLSHILNFSDIYEFSEDTESDIFAWNLASKALDIAITELQKMRSNEGNFLMQDLLARITKMEESIQEIEKISKERIPIERQKITEKVQQLLTNIPLDENRLELEIILLIDKLDVTEECIRFKSHINFFRESLNDTAESGKKLNFLVQEMNREINTIGSKANSAEISHIVVYVKEELEKIREQLQNIE
ncbi:MAG TPA: YicC family protein [Bacteroidota bacterium]|jgi:uncharacterized protein (TIGR00255 family)|nr:YicC family protein [Bacteroidota bacterium]